MAYKLEDTVKVVKSVNEKIKKADDLIVKLEGVLSSFTDSNQQIENSKNQIEKLVDEQSGLTKSMKQMQKDHEDFVEKKITDSYQETTKNLMELQLELNKKYEKTGDYLIKVQDMIKEIESTSYNANKMLMKNNKTYFIVLLFIALLILLVNTVQFFM